MSLFPSRCTTFLYPGRERCPTSAYFECGRPPAGESENACHPIRRTWSIVSKEARKEALPLAGLGVGTSGGDQTRMLIGLPSGMSLSV